MARWATTVFAAPQHVFAAAVNLPPDAPALTVAANNLSAARRRLYFKGS